MKISREPQGSEAWKALRLGVVTASEIDALVSPLGKVRTGQGPRSYLCRKVAEKLFGWSAEQLNTSPVAQGSIIETMAVPWYEVMHDVTVDRVGFCASNDGRIGCSPDGLVGEDGGIEVKAPQAPNHIEYLLAGIVPPDYVMQVQFSLYVTGRKWWDFVSFHPHMDKLVVRVMPDPALQSAIRVACHIFDNDFSAALSKLQPMMAAGGRA